MASLIVSEVVKHLKVLPLDLQAWQKEWTAAEADLKRINLEDIAEGRIKEMASYLLDSN